MRAASLKRKTKETDISIKIDLDGTGASAVCVDDQFSNICLKHSADTVHSISI